MQYHLLSTSCFCLLALMLRLDFAFAMRQPIENLVIFGDSQSDLGNAHRWTNGPAWSENLAVAWNASLYSFAYSGAVCDNALYPNVSDATPSIRDQIDLYYSLDMGLMATETVFGLWVGMNDIERIYGTQQSSPDDIRPTIEDIAFCIGQQIRQLRKAFGVNRIMVFAVPPLQYMPYFATATNRKEVGAAAEALSYLIRQDVGTINKHHHAFELDMIDIHSLLSDIVEIPDVFGFSNVADAYVTACGDGDGCTDNADQYMWWDHIHLAGGIHRTIANAVLSAGSYSAPGRYLEPSPAEINALLETPGCRFRSPIYRPHSNTGRFDNYIEELENAPLKTIYVVQDEDLSLNNSWWQRITKSHWLMVIGIAGSAWWCWWTRYRRPRILLDMDGPTGSPLHRPNALGAQHRGRVFSPFRSPSSAATSMSEQHNLRIYN